VSRNALKGNTKTVKAAAAIFISLSVAFIFSGCGETSKETTAVALSTRSTTAVKTTTVRPATRTSIATRRTSTKAKAPTRKSTKAQACNLPVSSDRFACEDSYTACATSAEAKVKAYYSGSGASLDSIAISYAKGVYGSSGYTWQAGYAGCLAALMDEYTRLYG
jgi:hypothetical protein